jgi:hypothetical protein
LSAVRDRVEVIEKRADYKVGINQVHQAENRGYSLSLAVFALAVEDTNNLESVITCAKPLASLFGVRACVKHQTRQDQSSTCRSAQLVQCGRGNHVA